MRKWTLLIIAGLIATGMAACAPKSQSDCGYVQNVYGERISWKGNIPVQMEIHQSVPNEYVSAIKSAARSWNDAAGTEVIRILDGRAGGTAAERDRRNVISFSSSWDADKLSEQAKTSVHWVGDQIQEADIKVNGARYASGVSVFNFYWQSAVGSGSGVNIEALVLHEMGHVLGLKHKETGGSVMATYLASNSNRIQLAEDDVTDVKCEY